MYVYVHLKQHACVLMMYSTQYTYNSVQYCQYNTIAYSTVLVLYTYGKSIYNLMNQNFSKVMVLEFGKIDKKEKIKERMDLLVICASLLTRMLRSM